MLFWLDIVALAAYTLIGLEVATDSRKTRFLLDIQPAAPDQTPEVSVIDAARKEERNIREALQSLLAEYQYWGGA